MRFRKLGLKALIPIYSFVIAVTIFAIVYVTNAYAWYAENRAVTGDGMSVVLEGENFEIYIGQNRGMYDATYQDESHNTLEVYEGIGKLKEYLEDDEATFNYSNDLVTENYLALELENEVEYEDSYFINPGSHGYFSFYIKFTTEEASEVSLDISLSGFKKKYENDQVGIEIPTTTKFTQALQMLNGHILFFKNRTVSNGEVTAYSGFINGTYTYTRNANDLVTISGVDYYHVTIYWDWPLLYELIVTELGTKYPNAVGEYVLAHPDYLFAGIETNGLFANKTISDLPSYQLGKLSDAYNDGDQLIGDNVHFLIVTLK